MDDTTEYPNDPGDILDLRKTSLPPDVANTRPGPVFSDGGEPVGSSTAEKQVMGGSGTVGAAGILRKSSIQTLRGTMGGRMAALPRRMLLAALVVALAMLYFPLNQADSSAVVLVGPLDMAIPVVPALSLPYLIFLPVFGLVFAHTLVTGRNFTKLALVIVIVCGCSDLIYLLAQTHVPRPSATGQGFFGQLLSYVYSHDRPFSDFPSEHAAFATVLALYLYSLRAKYWPVMVGFCLLVICATVMTKQHSLLGASCGVVVALIAWRGACDFAAGHR
jgi:membrane-associated phospholipid phosphatase